MSENLAGPREKAGQPLLEVARTGKGLAGDQVRYVWVTEYDRLLQLSAPRRSSAVASAPVARSSSAAPAHRPR
jgi:hypothetical protein